MTFNCLVGNINVEMWDKMSYNFAFEIAMSPSVGESLRRSRYMLTVYQFILRCTLNRHSKPISVLSICPDGEVLLSAGKFYSGQASITITDLHS